MNEYGERKRCAKCGAMVAVILIGAVGAETLQYHECRNLRSDLACREQDDMESKRDPYRPMPLGPRAVLTVSTSASTTSAVSVVGFQGLLK